MTLQRETPNSTDYPTGIGAKTYADAVSAEVAEICNRLIYRLGTAGGSANAITASVVGAAALSTLNAGMLFVLVPVANNTGATTLAIDSASAVSVKSAAGAALSGGEFKTGKATLLLFDGTDLRFVASGGGDADLINHMLFGAT